jgi:hypothetical protein
MAKATKHVHITLYHGMVKANDLPAPAISCFSLADCRVYSFRNTTAQPREVLARMTAYAIPRYKFTDMASPLYHRSRLMGILKRVGFLQASVFRHKLRFAIWILAEMVK